MKKCLGCGIILQSQRRDELGFTDSIGNNLCERCFKLKNYGLYRKVSYRILRKIPDHAPVLYIVDILSLDFSFIDMFDHPIVVVTKRDILPKSVKNNKIVNYLRNHYSNISDVVITSSKSGDGIVSLYQFISQYKEVYLVGATNSGKSTLINKFIHFYGKGYNYDVTASMYPSTTLDMVSIALDNVTLIDTPGLINDGNIVNYLEQSDIKKITPKKEIKPKSCQIEGRGSILISQYVRVDYDVKVKSSIVIYVSNDLEVRFANKDSDKLKNLVSFHYSLSSRQDIVIPGLGFIKCRDNINLVIYVKDGVVPNVRDNFI